MVGNLINKSELKNPISRWLVEGFDRALSELVTEARATSVHEVGCGEGRLLEQIKTMVPGSIRGTDLSRELVAELSSRHAGQSRFSLAVRSVDDLCPDEDSADLIICCEVLEHVPDPRAALRALRSLRAKSWIFSVPREPLWRVLNCCRGKYLRQWGNTPGHLNHWNVGAFEDLVQASGFEVQARKLPLPWIMLQCR